MILERVLIGTVLNCYVGERIHRIYFGYFSVLFTAVFKPCRFLGDFL